MVSIKGVVRGIENQTVAVNFPQFSDPVFLVSTSVSELREKIPGALSDYFSANENGPPKVSANIAVSRKSADDDLLGVIPCKVQKQNGEWVVEVGEFSPVP